MVNCCSVTMRAGSIIKRQCPCRIPFHLEQSLFPAMNVDGTIERLHQEDSCQALGASPDTKYQAEGGPNLSDCFQLLRSVSTNPVIDLRRLLDAVIFNFLIGNNDAHGKNFSLIYQGRECRLAPLYDVLSTASMFQWFQLTAFLWRISAFVGDCSMPQLIRLLNFRLLLLRIARTLAIGWFVLSLFRVYALPIKY